MTRYIDADAYIKYCEDKWIPLNVDAVTEQPTADVVEVVRCKDCKHHKERGWYNICDIHVGNGYPDNWFCADGELKDGDT